MAATLETYTATLNVLVDAQLPVDDDLFSRPVPVPCKKGQMTVTISRGTSERSTLVEIRWVFEDYFQESSGQDFDEKSWELWERVGVIDLPDQDGNVCFTKGIAVGEVLFRSCRPYLAALALVSRAPHFWSRLRDSDLHDLQGDISVDVAGHKVKLKPLSWSARPGVRPSGVSVARAIDLAAAPFPAYANFLITADRRFYEGDIADAVVHLAQGVEVAAYAYLRATVPALPAKWDFHVPAMFGPLTLRHPEIQAMNPKPLKRYPQICELFGSRHEWIHEGRRKVRLFDPITNKVPRHSPNLRDLTRSDFYEFRAATSEALTWMGNWAIE